MAEQAAALETCMHPPGAGWDSRLPRDKRRWWGFFWIYNLVMALIALAWFWAMPHHEIPSRMRAVSPQEFHAEVEQFVRKHETAPDSGIVAVPPGEDAYIEARMWQWYPTLKLKAGQPYTIWLSSVDVSHSLVFPGGKHMIFDAIPGHMQGVRLTPLDPGTYLIYCAEFCGIGHQDMAGRLIVEP